MVSYRRSPCVIAAWTNAGFVLINYATKKYVAAAPLTCEVLDCFTNWRGVDDLSDLLPQYSRTSLAAAVRQLTHTTLLQRSDRLCHPVERAIESWEDWNPAAGLFHFSTKDLEFERDRAKLANYYQLLAQRTPMVSAVKRYPGATRIFLPPPACDAEFSRVLLARRTWREFAKKPIDYSDLATTLWLTFGVQRWFDFYDLGKLAIKTSPSGGARHPIEAYVVARRVKGLKPGVYHYACDRHEFEQLQGLPSARLLRSLTPAQDWCCKAACMVFMTAVFGRDQWKYHFPRAYRAVLLDAGHVCQTFCLTATWLGLAPYCTMALADSKIERLLGVDGVSEGAIYLAGIGARPEGLPKGSAAQPNVPASPIFDQDSSPKRRSNAAKVGSERSGS